MLDFSALANVTSIASLPGQYDPSIVKKCETYPLSTTDYLNYFGVENRTDDNGVWQLSPKSVYDFFHFGDYPKVNLKQNYMR